MADSIVPPASMSAIDAVSPALILLGGCLAVLVVGVWRMARSAPRWWRGY